MHRKYPYKESTLCFCIPIIWIILLSTNSPLYRIRLFLPKHAVARTRRDRTLLLPVMHIIRKPFPDVSQMASVAAPQTHHHHSLVLRAMPVSISLVRRCFGPCRPRRSPFFRGGDETASPPVTMNGMSSIAASLSGACASRPSDAKNCGERWKFFSSCFVAV